MSIPEKSVWYTMKARCFNPNNAKYHRYGGRGIAVCERWLSFENFIADMGRRPSSRHTLERKDNNGNYEPDNVCWATMKEQGQNTSIVKRITFEGQTRTVTGWAEFLGVTQGSMSRRLATWPIERALTERKHSPHDPWLHGRWSVRGYA